MLSRSIALLLGGSALFLAGCSPEKSGTEAAKSASLSASGEPLRAGLYQVVQTGDVDIEEERCFRAEDVAAGRFAMAKSAGDGWTVETNRMSAGTIEVAARHPSGSRLTIGGRFERESFAVDGVLELKLNGETHIVRTRQQGKFVSPTCPDGMD